MVGFHILDSDRLVSLNLYGLPHHGLYLSGRVSDAFHRESEFGHLHGGHPVDLVPLLLLDLVGLPGLDGLGMGDIQVGLYVVPGCWFGDEWAVAPDAKVP